MRSGDKPLIKANALIYSREEYFNFIRENGKSRIVYGGADKVEWGKALTARGIGNLTCIIAIRENGKSRIVYGGTDEVG